TFHPKRYRARANTQPLGYRVHAHTRAHQAHHFSARLLNARFLDMINPYKKPKPYFNRSTNAET
ncbi:MAG: hypothetical protein Q8K18_02285, partial [Burkholderiales bacterium]|nr:hypothetical protein [Burkholderiales bacterium]